MPSQYLTIFKVKNMVKRLLTAFKKKEEPVEAPKKVKISKVKIGLLIGGLIIGIVIGLVVASFSGGISHKISGNEAGVKARNYVVENFLSAQGMDAEVVDVEAYGNNLYVVNLNIIQNNRTVQTAPVYITQDGKLLILGQVLDLSEPIEREQPTPTGAAGFNCETVEKAAKPNVKFFVMAFCPFGNQAEDGLEPVFRLLGDKVEWEPHYVIYSNYASGYPEYCLDEENKYCSMHGIQELNQGVRELCVWKYSGASAFWDFVMKVNDGCSAQNVDTCWESKAEEVGIDVDKIKTCQEEEAIDLLAAEVALNEQYGVRGSPSVFINEQQYSGGRAPENYRAAICCAFTEEPEECSTQLSASGASAGGQC